MTEEDAAAITLQPIGVVRSPYHTRRDVEPWGGRGTLEIDPRYEAGLSGVERSSHIHVIGFLHAADRAALVARGRRRAPDAPPVGVFACRSPARPNPLSLTVCRLLRRRGCALDVDGLDLLDGTPLIDVKPYNPGWDDVFCASRQRRVRPAILDEAELHFVLEHALVCHLGRELASDPRARRALRAVYLAVRAFDLDPRDPELRATLGQADLEADALIGLLGATFASGRLRLRPTRGSRIAFCAGRRVLVVEGEPACARELDGASDADAAIDAELVR